MNRTEMRTFCSTWSAVIVAAFTMLGSATADEKPSNNNSAVTDDPTEAPSKLPAMEGTFDRSVEVGAYAEVLSAGTKGQITAAANELFWSGISSRQLADQLHDLLLRDAMDIPNPESTPPVPRFSWTYEESYGVAIIRALASMGMTDYNATFEKLAKAPRKGGAVNKRVRNAAASAYKIVAFHAGLNEAMASRENHIEGGDPITSMLINLLKSGNRLFCDFALDKIQREKLHDTRLLDFLESQVIDYMNRAPVATLGWQETFMRRNIKLLGLSDKAKYRDTMEAVLVSNVDEGAKKHARVASNRLFTFGT